MSMSLGAYESFSRKTTVGWIAARLNTRLDLGFSEGRLIQCAMEASQVEAPVSCDDRSYLVFLADRLLSWISADKDVYLSVKDMTISDPYAQTLLEVYEEIKVSLHQKFAPRNDCQDDEGRLWEVYKDVIYASTQRKFLLIKEEELERFREGNLLCAATIQERPDIPNARQLSKESLERAGIPASKIMSYLLLISEAVTNVLKHAKDGRLEIYQSHPFVHVVVSDSGGGFPLKILPNTVLISGYSTKKSLGQGFTLMMKMADKLFLKTSSTGATLVMQFTESGGDSDARSL